MQTLSSNRKIATIHNKIKWLNGILYTSKHNICHVLHKIYNSNISLRL